MTARVKRVKGPDPWKERFAFEARKHTKDPFPEGRKGKSIAKRRKIPKAY